MQDSRPEIARERVKRKKNKIKTGVAYSVPLTPRIKKKEKTECWTGIFFYNFQSFGAIASHI